MKTTVYLSRKLLNQLKVKETESKDLMLTHNLHNIIINGKRVGCSGAVIPGSFSQWHAPFACGKPPSSVLPILAWF